MLLNSLLVIAGLIALVFLLALLAKKEFSLRSETLINQPKDLVFDYIKQLKNQENYSKWVMADPNIQLTYSGIDGKVGFRAAWVSNMKNVGVGEQEITKITDGEKYEVEIRFEKPFKATHHAFTTTSAVSPTQTKVTTTFYGKTTIPLNLMAPVFHKMLRKDMDENAANLKRQLEKSYPIF